MSTKAQLRVPLDKLLPLLPPALHIGVRGSRYYAQNTNSLLLQSDESRKQSDNQDTCYRKLNDMLIGVYKATIPGETSNEQKEKVQKLKRAENESRLKSKKMQSSKKSSRSNGFHD